MINLLSNITDIRTLNMLNDIKVENINGLFDGCGDLIRIENNGFKIIGCRPGMNATFYECFNLEEIDMSMFEFRCRNKDFMQSMTFCDCENLKSIKNLYLISDIENPVGFTTYGMTFTRCKSLKSIEFNGTAISPTLNKDVEVSFEDSPLLTDESMRHMIVSLGKNETGYLRKIIIAENVMNSLSKKTKQMFESKNYTLKAKE